MEARNRPFDAAIVSSGILLAISGYMKWIPLGLDPTAVAAGAGALAVLCRTMTMGVPLIKRSSFRLVGLISVLLVIATATSLYSPSEQYIWTKISQTILLLLSVIFISSGKDPSATVVKYIQLVSLVTLVLLAFILVRDRSLGAYFHAASIPDSLVPDYLSVSMLLAIGVLSRLRSRWPAFSGFAFGASVMMLLLGGRGPVIFLVLVLLATMLFQRVRRRTFGLLMVFFLAAPIMMTALSSFFDSGGDFFSRMDVLVGGDSTAARLQHIKTAGEAIQEAPFLGIGYGAYGVHTEGIDARLYPHNFLLELWVELGIMGLTIGAVIIGTAIQYVWLATTATREKDSDAQVVLGFILLFLLLEAMKSSSIVDLRLLFVVLAALAASRVGGMSHRWRISAGGV